MQRTKTRKERKKAEGRHAERVHAESTTAQIPTCLGRLRARSGYTGPKGRWASHADGSMVSGFQFLHGRSGLSGYEFLVPRSQFAVSRLQFPVFRFLAPVLADLRMILIRFPVLFNEFYAIMASLFRASNLHRFRVDFPSISGIPNLCFRTTLHPQLPFSDIQFSGKCFDFATVVFSFPLHLCTILTLLFFQKK